MREAGAPSTGEDVVQSVPAPPGVVMVAPPEVPRNAKAAPGAIGWSDAANNRRIIKAAPREKKKSATKGM
jgi:hypothetical protein